MMQQSIKFTYRLGKEALENDTRVYVHSHFQTNQWAHECMRYPRKHGDATPQRRLELRFADMLQFDSVHSNPGR